MSAAQQLRQGNQADTAVPCAARSEHLVAFKNRLRAFSARVDADLVDLAGVGRKTFAKDYPAWADRSDLQNLVVLQSGWCYKFHFLGRGQRYIADFCGPGALVNWSRLSEFNQRDDVLFKKRSEVTLLDTCKLEAVLTDNPSLESAIKHHELARELRTAQRVRSVITLTATDSLLVLLLDIVDEARAGGWKKDWLKLPFSQSELADFLGLSPVHVSRTLKIIEDAGVLERSGLSIRFSDIDGLEQKLGYQNYFKSLAGR